MKAKEKLFKVMDRIDELKSNLLDLNNEEQNELENLEVKKMEYWSEWKD
tara:strand:+ start:68 stop:214 length:147 start_codon:yes stop_codon:yes gene_type:complete